MVRRAKRVSHHEARLQPASFKQYTWRAEEVDRSSRPLLALMDCGCSPEAYREARIQNLENNPM